MYRNLFVAVWMTALSLFPLTAMSDISFSEESAAVGFPSGVTPTYGASVGDINGDGWPDLFLNNHALPSSILANDGDGTFTDVTEAVDEEDFLTSGGINGGAFDDTHGASWIDYDNDGDQDLLVTTGDCCDPQFMVNSGGRLYNRTIELGFGDDADAGGRLPIWFDGDGDGRLEVAMTGLYSSNFLAWDGDKFVSRAAEVRIGGCSDTQFGVLIDLNDDGKLDLLCVKNGGVFDAAYDVSSIPFRWLSNSDTQTGLLPEVVGVNDVIIGDFDNDLHNDMLLLNGALRPSEGVIHGNNRVEVQLVNQFREFSFRTSGRITVDLNWNRATTKFANIFIGADGRNPVIPTYTLDPNDPANQGLAPRDPDDNSPAVYLGYDLSSRRWEFKVYPGTLFTSSYFLIDSSEPVSDLQITEPTPRELPLPPVMVANRGSGNFEVATAAANLDQPILCVGGAAGDYDNDMDVDIYLVCRGGVTNIPNILLENDGSGRFTAVASAGGAEGVTGVAVSESAGVGEGVVTSDFDQDGRLDFVVTNGLNLRPEENSGGPTQYFKNTSTAGNWLQFDLVGVNTARDAIGARVFVTTPDGTTQMRAQNDGYHRWSQNHKRIHVGLGDNTSADVTVRWPGGGEDTFTAVEAGSIYRVTEATSIEVIYTTSTEPPEPPQPPEPPEPPPSGGNGGGGSGSFGLATLLALAAVLLLAGPLHGRIFPARAEVRRRTADRATGRSSGRGAAAPQYRHNR